MEWCNELEENLIRMIRMGGTISAPELASHLRVTDRRVRALINHLRKDHCIPICSTPNDGYYWPKNRDAASHTIGQLKSRINDIELVIWGIEEGLDLEFGPQLIMDMEAG